MYNRDLYLSREIRKFELEKERHWENNLKTFDISSFQDIFLRENLSIFKIPAFYPKDIDTPD